MARTLSNTFAGVAPGSLLAFVAAQAGGAVVAALLIRLLWPRIAAVAQDVVMPHGDRSLARP